MRPVLSNDLKAIDRAIRSGKGEAARVELERLIKRPLPRELLVPVGALLRRAHLNLHALRLLSPYVRPQGKKSVDANEAERLEYAANLTYIGANEEALALLDGIPHDAFPNVLLFRAFALFGIWDYENAIPLLTSYIKTSDLPPYDRTVGKLNLVAALVHERRHWQANVHLKDLLYQTSLSGYRLLHANTLELAAQHLIFQRKWQEAEEIFAKGESFLSKVQGREILWLAKWRAIAAFLRARDKSKAAEGLFLLKEQAQKSQNWETIRDCDRYLAIALRDQGLFERLYVGTPFEPFRRELIHSFDGSKRLPQIYDWQLREGEGTKLIDLTDERGIGKEPLRPGELLHRLLNLLASDFYRPQRVAPLHYRLHAGEHFHAGSSQRRIYETIRRLRIWLKEESLPLTVAEDEGAYFLKASAPMTLRVGLSRAIDASTNLDLDKLRRRWPETVFSAEDAAKALSISPRSALRLLVAGMDQQKISRKREGKKTRYFFKPET